MIFFKSSAKFLQTIWNYLCMTICRVLWKVELRINGSGGFLQINFRTNNIFNLFYTYRITNKGKDCKDDLNFKTWLSHDLIKSVALNIVFFTGLFNDLTKTETRFKLQSLSERPGINWQLIRRLYIYISGNFECSKKANMSGLGLFRDYCFINHIW